MCVNYKIKQLFFYNSFLIILLISRYTEIHR